MRVWGILGALGLLLGVALGAFGAHGLRRFIPPDRLNVFEVGVRYQLIHAVALLVVAVLVERVPTVGYTGLFYTLGILLFSFSLYALALTGARWFAFLTPFGGVCFLLGHLFLLIGFLRLRC
ncbi:MAG: DUF423 domain-containing protein [Acidobacteria bacterium]|nr:DUF423 domain-containing protein [Acidobacteriota bacterium]MDW7983298.1 DUF423 domain-containing protein [Acidobacteriota bacterium]